MASPKLAPVVLSDEERSVLTGWARRRKTAQALALRSRIVLACAEDGATIASVSGGLEVSRATVSKWRGRFLAAGLEGLSDEPRPGRPRTIPDDQVDLVIVKTLEETPGGHALVDARDGGRDRAVAVGHLADLAGVRFEAARGSDLEAVHGSAVRGQGP